MEPNKKREITVRDLYPSLNEEQLKETEDNLDRYLEIVLRIYERILRDRIETQEAQKEGSSIF